MSYRDTYNVVKDEYNCRKFERVVNLKVGRCIYSYDGYGHQAAPLSILLGEFTLDEWNVTLR